MSLNKNILLLILAFLLIPVVPIRGVERTQDESQDYLASLSSHIMIGKVESIESRWNDDMTLIYSYAHITVEEHLKGITEGRQVIVKYLGGKADWIGLWVSSEPSFMIGERVKLYLKLENTGEFSVVYGWKGKTTLDKPEASAQWYSWPGLKWFTLPVQYYINDLVPASYSIAVQASAQTWEDDDASYWDLTYVGTTNRIAGVKDGYNVVSWGDVDGPGGTLAVSTIWFLASQIIETDIRFDSAEAWSTTGEPSKFDVQNIATHEFGHWILLEDLYSLADKEETMYGYASAGETKKRTLYVGDMAGIRVVYPYPSEPTISMAIDKTSYAKGETMVAALIVTNPTGNTYTSNVVIKIVLPSSSKVTIFDYGPFTLKTTFGGAKFGSLVIPFSASSGSYQFEATLTYGSNTNTYLLPFDIS